MANGEVLNMPEDVLIHILSWLPVKSLARFKCVCKAWFDLMRNPNFISKHHLNQITLNRINLLVRHGEGDKIFSVISPAVTYRDGDEEILTVTESSHIQFTTSFSGDAVALGPCNGLICLFNPSNAEISLWNPSTREFRALPLSPIKLSNTMFWNCGFGFDRKTNDYKVLRIATEYLKQGTRWLSRAEMYSLNSNSWREIPTPEDLPVVIGDIPCFNRYHDGRYYWRAFRDPGGLILSFDFADEVFDMLLPLPHLGERIFWNNYSWHISIFNGCVAAVFYSWRDPEKSFDLWVMTEQGVNDSWVKQARIGPISGVERPLAFWKNGGLFLRNSKGHLVLYDPRTQQLRNLQLPGPEGTLQVVTYVESLVPINGQREDPSIRTRIRMLYRNRHSL